jgi:hypothetical protein
MDQQTGKEVSRRNYLATAATGAAMLAAGALALPAVADEGQNGGDTLYGHGMVWNRNLPGVPGDLRLSFDLRLDLIAGTGLGTAEDPTHPEWGVHFDIDSVERVKRPKGETRFIMRGAVTAANGAVRVGSPVRIIAETVGDTTAIAIAMDDLAFGGAGLIVISVLRTLLILIGVLPDP